MNITKRTCANCAYFYPGDNTIPPHCENSVEFVMSQEMYRVTVASEYCCEHQTQEEVTEEKTLLEANGYDIMKMLNSTEAKEQEHRSYRTPEFNEAMSTSIRLAQTLGMDHPEAIAALMLALSLAPETMIEELGGKLQNDGLMPKACGYLEDGTPVFSMEDIAEKLCVPKDEARDSALRFLATCTEQGLPNGLIDPKMVHMLQ